MRMNVTAKRENTANAVITASVSSEAILKQEDKIAHAIGKNAKVSGFRKGKVPVNVIKKMHKEDIKNQTNQEIFSAVLRKSIEDLGISQNEVLGEPIFEKFDDKDGKIDMEFKISIKPQIDLKDYKSLIPQIKVPKISAKKVDESLQGYLNNFATFDDAKDDKKVESGDIAVIDFEGYLGDEKFEGGSAKAHSLEIGSNSFIPGFEDQVIGMSKGEDKDITVTFPAQYGAANLAGKEVVFKVNLNKIQIKSIPKELSEDQLKQFLPNEEKPSLEILKEQIKEQLFNTELAKTFNEDVRNVFTEALIKDVKFDLPQSVIEKEIDALLNRDLKDKTKEEIQKIAASKDEVKKLRDGVKEEASKNVQLTFILSQLAEAEKVDVSDQEVSNVIFMEAYQSGKNPKEHYELYEKRGILPMVKMSLIENKLFDQLFREKAGIKPVEKSTKK